MMSAIDNSSLSSCITPILFFREFQHIASASNDSSLLFFITPILFFLKCFNI